MALDRDAVVAANLVENRVIDGIKLLDTINHALHHDFSGDKLSPDLISRGLSSAYQAYAVTSDLSPYGIVHVVDRDGMVIASSDSTIKLPLSVADRYYFRALKDNPSQRFLVGPTVLSRTTSRYVFHIAEPLNNESPAFKGLLVLHGLEAELVKELEASIGRATRVEVSSRNNELIALIPPNPSIYNQQSGVLGQLEKIQREQASLETNQEWIIATSTSPILGLSVYAAESRAAIFREFFETHCLSYLLMVLYLGSAALWYRALSASLKRKIEFTQLEAILEKSLTVIGRMVEFRDPYTQGHQQRVAKMSCDIAVEMGLEPELCRLIYKAGLVHDVGKIGIPIDILRKTSRLTQSELELVRTHPLLGWEILKDLAPRSGIAEIVRHHHERLDGSGYPDQLHGEAIPLASRIIAVADALDAMTSTRPYRTGREIKMALEELERGKDVLYDSDVIMALLRLAGHKAYTLQINSPEHNRPDPQTSGMDTLVHKAMDGLELQDRFEKMVGLSEQTIDSAHDAIFWVDADGQISFVNRAGCELLGYPHEALIGRSLAFIAPAFLKDGWTVVWKQIRSDLRLMHSCWLQPAKGALIPVEITTSLVNFDGSDYGCLFCREYSNRRLQDVEEDQRRFDLENQIRMDDLTEIPNRRGLDERLDYEWRRRSRTHAPLAVLMIDIDHFKTYNDFYGHLAGDAVLKEVAQRIAHTVSRAGDFVGRYGGEEFLAILPGLTESEAIKVAEKIRLTLDHAADERDATGMPRCAQVSIGVASTESAGHSPFTLEDSWQTLVAAADSALYDAKRRGRNRVVSISQLRCSAMTHPHAD